jgi:hypothetical protein
VRDDGSIDAYLADLECRLHVGALRRRRILAEAEDHLHSAATDRRAAGAAPEEAERFAIDRFGRVRDVADRFNRQWRVYTRLAGAAVVAGVGVVFFTVQNLMEGMVPPAPWPEEAAPAAVSWQVGPAGICVLAALLLGLLALAGRPWSASVAGLGLVALALAAAFVSHYDVERAALVVGSPSGWEIAGVIALRAAALVAAGLVLAGRLRAPTRLLPS